MLKALGLDKAVAAARSIEDLRRIALDVDSAEIALALRDALHPASGQRQEHFRGLKEGSLKAILRNRFAEWKKDREATLRRGKAPKSDWTDQLILDKDGKIRPILANLILILGAKPRSGRACSAMTNSPPMSSSDRPPPWGGEPPDSPWVDHHELLARVWFQKRAASIRRPGTWGERCRRRPGIMPSIRCATTSTRWSGMACRDWTRGWSTTSTPRIAPTSARSGRAI